MIVYLRQSTASQEIPLGMFLDTDGAAVTTLTVANTDVRLWKTGATSAVAKNSGGATHMEGGDYYCVLDATDTDTIGPMRVRVHVSGALPVAVSCCVLHANVFDVLFGSVAPSTHTAAAVQALVAAGAVASVTGAVGSVTGNVGGDVVGSVGSVTAAVTVTGTPAVNVTQISGDSTAADNLESACDGTGFNLGAGSIVAASVTGNIGGSVGGNVVGSVAFVEGDVGGDVGGKVLGGGIGTIAGIGAEVDLAAWLGTAPEAPNTPGVPVVDVGYVDGGAASAGSAASIAAAVAAIFGVVGSVNDTLPGASSFDGNAELSSEDDFYGSPSRGATLLFTSGPNAGIARLINNYAGSTRTLEFNAPFPDDPGDGDEFVIIGLIEG